MTRNLRFKSDAEFKEFLTRTGRGTKALGSSVPASQDALRLKVTVGDVLGSSPDSKTRQNARGAAVGRVSPKGNKFSARKVTVDNLTFDSQAEAKRYGELKLLERAGKIRDLRVHWPIRCMVNGKLICTLKPDFGYWDDRIDQLRYEDVKGFKRGSHYALFRVKKKLAEALYGITIKEVDGKAKRR